METKPLKIEKRGLMCKINIHHKKYSEEQLDAFRQRIEEIDALLENTIQSIEKPIETQEKPMESVETNTKQEEPETVTESVVKPIDLTEDESFFQSLKKEVYVAPKIEEKKTDKIEEEEKEDFEETISDEVAAKMAEIEEKEEKESSPNMAFSASDDGENVDVMLSPKEGADFITAFVESGCREFLPALYDYTIWTKDEQEQYKIFSQKRRAFKAAQKRGEIPKNEVYFEEDEEIELFDKFDRLQEYKENAPLTVEESKRLRLALVVYLQKKKIAIAPESALFMAVFSIVLAKASPIVKEKGSKFLEKLQEKEETKEELKESV